MKHKVYNKNKFNIGIRLINPTREQNIIAGSFAMLDDDDIYYLNTICTLFKRGMLVLDDDEVNTNLGFVESNPNCKSDDDIKEILKTPNILKMKKELSTITEPHIKDAVFRIAKSMADSMTISKLKCISEFCGRDVFLDEF